MRPSPMAAGRAGRASATTSPTSCRTSSRISSAMPPARRARPERRRARARRRHALQPRDHPRGGLPRQDRRLKIPTSITCEACSGSGAKPGSKPKACPTCGGAGRVRATQGFFSIERTCPNCHGRGEVIDDPCAACGGAGRVTRERTLSVNIPAGVEDGTRIRLAGEGEAGLRGGPAGDLYIFLSIKAAPVLPARRRGPVLPRADLHGHGGARRRVQRADARRLRRAR